MNDSARRKNMEERRKKFPQLIEYLESQLGNEYNYWIIECVFRGYTEREGTQIDAIRGTAMDVKVGPGTYVECGVEEKTKSKKKVQKMLDSDGNTVSDFVEEKTIEEQDLECYRIDSIALTVGGEELGTGLEKWIAKGHFSVDVSRLSKFAKEYSGSIAALCAKHHHDSEYEVEFIGEGNEISVSIKPVESDEIPDITELRYSMMGFVEGLLYS